MNIGVNAHSPRDRFDLIYDLCYFIFYQQVSALNYNIEHIDFKICGLLFRYSHR